MWLFHRQPKVWQPPPCICKQVERHVHEAIAMRDEMARWKTPLEEWLALQVMPVLQVKSEPKLVRNPAADVIARTAEWSRSMQVSSATRQRYVRSEPQSGYYYIGSRRVGPSYSPPPVDLSVSSLAILPSDGDVQPGLILKRGNGWYKVLSVGHDRMTVQRYY